MNTENIEDIDNAYNALSIFPEENSEEEDESAEDQFEEAVQMKVGGKRIDTAGIRKIEKYLITKNSAFVPLRKLKKTYERYGKDDVIPNTWWKKKISTTENFKKAICQKLTNGSEVAIEYVVINYDSKQVIDNYFKFYGKWKKFSGLYKIQLSKGSSDGGVTENNTKIAKWVESIENDKIPKFESVEETESVEKILSPIERIDGLFVEAGMEVIDFTEDTICVFDEDDEFMESSTKIDDDIKNIIDILNEKGYKTIYSCSGHPSARSKDDIYRDGIKNDKLYSTARVVFDKVYAFPNIPEGWKKKVMGDKDGKVERVGIYVKPPTFNIINGLPTKQFYRWKQKYMYHLEKWAKDLPKENELKEDTNKNVAVESADDIFNDMLFNIWLECGNNN